jgi:hypothetical protein
MIIIDEPNVPYKKKKESNTSKANKKSKHKHIYDKVAILETHGVTWNMTNVFQYCSVCGKIGPQLNRPFKVEEWNLTEKDWANKYPNADYFDLGNKMPIFDINNINEVK